MFGALVLVGQLALGQSAPSARTPAAPVQTPGVRTSKGLPPRGNPAEYSSHAQAGTVTIAADFHGHSVPTTESTLTTEDFVAVEVAMFGPPGSHTTVSFSDFSLRINGKKAALPAEQFAAVFRNLRDPEWFPPETEETKAASKTSVGGGGQNGADTAEPPPPVHIPPELERAMQLHVQNAALPEGDRTLPIDGLIFFRYSGAPKGIRSVELLYTGAAGKAVVPLQP